MTFEFLSSTGLFAAAAAVVGVILSVILGFVDRRALFSIHGLLRAAAVLLLCVALSQPSLVRTETYARGTILVDISESMSEAEAADLLAKAKEFGGRDAELEIIPFAKTAAPIGIASGAAGSYSALRSSWGKLNVGGTNLEAAFEGPLSAEGQNILLVSDGFETEGGIAKILPNLAARGNKVFPLVPEDAGAENAQFVISQLHAPLIAPAQKSVEIRTSILNSTGERQSGTLEVKHGEKVVLRRDVSIGAGEETLVLAESDPQSEGIKEITATLRPTSRGMNPSVERIYLSSEEREKVLLVSGTAEDERILKQVLKDQAYQLKSVLAGQAELASVNPSDYAVVLLNNIGKEEVPRKLLESLPQFTKDGGGFAMIGGNKSFGLGGYIGSVIEPVLPVELVPPQTEKKRLNVALALVMDKSGSMSQGSRLEYAKESALEVIRNLKDDDFIMVMGFDDAPFVVIKMSPVGEVRAQAAERIGRLFSAGRTNLLPAIDEARRGLMKAQAGRKHMIVLTDGKLPDEGPLYIDLTKQLRQLGITLSTVLLGSESDFDFLKSLAEVGGGGFYQTSDARNLPRIFLQDVRVSGGERTMKESSEYAVRVGNGEVTSTKLRSFPPVRGYVQTKSKPSANLELVTLGAERAEPLLASWKFGKGRAVAFTSDANGRWSNLWVDWPKFYQFWTEILDSLRSASSADDAPLRFNLRTSVEQGDLKLTLEVFGERDPGEIAASVVAPDGATRALGFSRAAKGLYEAAVKSPMPGRYELRGTAGASKLTPVAFYISGELFGEQKGRGFNRGMLERIASETGGAVNPSRDEVQSFTQSRKRRSEISTWLVALGMLFLALGILFREVPQLRARFKVAPNRG